MKILLVHYRYYITGGPERYMFNLISSLEELGHEVIPFSIKMKQNHINNYADYFARNIGNSDTVFVNDYPKNLRTYFDLISREFYSFYVKRKLKKLILDTKPDICYLLVYKRALSPSVIDACFDCHLPIVNRISDYNTVCAASSLFHKNKYCDLCLKNDSYCIFRKCVQGSFVFTIVRYLSIKLSKLLNFQKKIDAFVCTNSFMIEKMVAYGYDSQKINLIPTFFRETDEYKSLNKSQIIGQKINFLFIGNVDESKGVFDLINALALVKVKTISFSLKIVGGLHKKTNSKMLDLIRNYNLETFVEFVPFVNSGKVFEYYLKSNVSIIPARWVENLPNTLIESIFFHRPVVVPNWGSFLSTTDESVAFRYKALDFKSLADVIYNVIQNPDNIIRKSNNCQKYFESHYSEKSHINSLLKLFDKLIKK